MAITAEAVSLRVNILLNNGTSETGGIKTITMSIGTLDTSNYDRQKAVNVVDALGNVLDRSVYDVREVTTNSLSSD